MKCPHCGKPMLYQPSQVQYWCQSCRVAIPKQVEKLLQGEAHDD